MRPLSEKSVDYIRLVEQLMNLLKNTEKCVMIVLIMLIFSSSTMFAQFMRAGSFGIRAGASWNNFSGLSDILVSESFFPKNTYVFTDKTFFSPTASLFFNYHPRKSFLGFAIGFNYHQLCTQTTYDDINYLTYTLKLQYHYVGIDAYFKVYPIKGLYFGIGGFAGFNLSPTAITYNSNQEEAQYFTIYHETVDQTAGYLKDKLVGKSDLGAGAELGYEFPFGFCIELSYGYSIADLIESRSNTYNWIENKNNAHRVAFTLGWAFGVTKR